MNTQAQLRSHGRSKTSVNLADCSVYLQARRTLLLSHHMNLHVRGNKQTNSGITQPRVCESCEVIKPLIWNCPYCDMNFCDQCWAKQGPHQIGRPGPDGLPYEKVDPITVKRLKDILTPPEDQGKQQRPYTMAKDTR